MQRRCGVHAAIHCRVQTPMWDDHWTRGTVGEKRVRSSYIDSLLNRELYTQKEKSRAHVLFGALLFQGRGRASDGGGRKGKVVGFERESL